MKLVAILFLSLFLASCEKEDERAVRSAVDVNWSTQDIDIRQLSIAINACRSELYVSLHDECKRIIERGDAIADAAVTCKNDISDILCRQMLGAVIELASLAKFGNAPKAVVLPKTPFYWSTNNEYFDAMDGFPHRSDLFKKWWSWWYASGAGLLLLLFFLSKKLFEWLDERARLANAPVLDLVRIAEAAQHAAKIAHEIKEERRLIRAIDDEMERVAAAAAAAEAEAERRAMEKAEAEADAADAAEAARREELTRQAKQKLTVPAKPGKRK